MQFAAIAWNLFHGRDFPPDPRLLSWRSRILRISERGTAHVQVNRSLEHEFGALLSAERWHVALLQECPPRFAPALARACGAEPHLVLTSRNCLAPLRTLAARLNPDLIASNEGGSNLTLLRRGGPLGVVVERRETTIHAGPPERRAMALTRTSSGICLANLHASSQPARAAEDVLRAAERASRFAGEAPLLFGGDLNLRPRLAAGVFEALAGRFGLAPPSGPEAIDHLLGRGLEVVLAPTPWPARRREVEQEGLAIRLSDHAPVEAVFETASAP